MGLDATLFRDDDGTVYYLFAGYNIARMRDDMSDFAESPREVEVQPSREWGEGVFLLKIGNRYVLTNSGTSISIRDGKVATTYDSYAVTSTTSIYGPYTGRYRALPHAGHNNYFEDRDGRWWSSYFGSGDDYAPWIVEAGVIPVKINEAGKLSAERMTPWPEWKYTFERPDRDWSGVRFDDRRWSSGATGFGDRSIMDGGSVSFVNTDWNEGEIWARRIFTISVQPRDAALYLRYTGDVDVYVNGKSAAHLRGATDDYVVQPIDIALLKKGRNSIAVHESAPTVLPTPIFASEQERSRFGGRSLPAYRYLDVGLVEKRNTVEGNR
jgi:hypothetical protein